MESKAFSLVVVAQIPLSVIVLSLPLPHTHHFRWSIFPYYTILMQRWKFQTVSLLLTAWCPAHILVCPRVTQLCYGTFLVSDCC